MKITVYNAFKVVNGKEVEGLFAQFALEKDDPFELMRAVRKKANDHFGNATFAATFVSDSACELIRTRKAGNRAIQNHIRVDFAP